MLRPSPAAGETAPAETTVLTDSHYTPADVTLRVSPQNIPTLAVPVFTALSKLWKIISAMELKY